MVSEVVALLELPDGFVHRHAVHGAGPDVSGGEHAFLGGHEVRVHGQGDKGEVPVEVYDSGKIKR